MLLVRTAIPLLLISLLTAPSCKRLDVEPESAKSVKVLGHGGVGFQSPRNQLPHNSLQSVIKAVEFYGAHGVEVDVQMSKSGTLWMYHDLTLETQSDCFGCITQKTDEELARCRYKEDVQVNVLNGPYYLAPLKDFIRHVQQYTEKPYLFLDVRTVTVCEGMSRDSILTGTIREILAASREYGNYDRLYLNLRDRVLTENIKTQNPEIKILLETDFVKQADLNFVKQHGLEGMILNNRKTSDVDVRQLHNEGLEVCLFGVKVQDGVVEAINKSPEFIMTDNLPLTINVLNVARD